MVLIWLERIKKPFKGRKKLILQIILYGAKANATVTAALPTPADPYIGHLAGVYVPAIFMCYLHDKDVAFILGAMNTVAIYPRQKGSKSKAIIDKYDKMIKESFQQLGISFDNYSPSPPFTTKQHEFFAQMHVMESSLKKQQEQLYDPNNQFLADRFVTGNFKCDHTEAYDQWNCGSSLNATDLIHPNLLSRQRAWTKGHQTLVFTARSLPRFYSEMDRDGHKHDWKPNVYGQVKSVDDGLKPRAVTRDLDWKFGP